MKIRCVRVSRATAVISCIRYIFNQHSSTGLDYWSTKSTKGLGWGSGPKKLDWDLFTNLLLAKQTDQDFDS